MSNTDNYQYIPKTVPKDRTRLYMDMLPSELRTVQKSGISLFNLKYQSKILDPYMQERDKHTNRKMRFRIRFDPRDIRHIYFYDHIKEGYFKIKCSNPHFVRIFGDRKVSKWEWDAFNNQTAKHGKSKEDHELKMSIVGTQIEMDAISQEKTNQMKKRNALRKKRNQDLDELLIEIDVDDSVNKEEGAKRRNSVIDPRKFKKREIDWSEVEKLPTDSMYKGR